MCMSLCVCVCDECVYDVMVAAYRHIALGIDIHECAIRIDDWNRTVARFGHNVENGDQTRALRRNL